MKTERLHTFSAVKSIKNLLKLVGAGLKCPPEQSTRIKQLASVMKAVILIFYVTDYKIQLPYGRAQRPAPTTENIKFSHNRGCAKNFPAPHLISNI